MLFDHLKKPAVVAVSLALAVGIAPMAAFAAEENLGDVELTTQEETADIDTGMTPIYVDQINVTITQPVAGESSTDKPQATTTNEGIEILSDNNHWVESDGGSMLSTTFVEGETYDAMIQLALKDGYQISGGNIRLLPVNITNGTLNSINDEGFDFEHASIIELWIKTKAIAAGAPAADPATTPAEEPAATDEPAAADESAAADEPAAADSNDDATATATTSEAGTMPKTADTLPIALLGAMVLMSALVLAMAWRLRKN